MNGKIEVITGPMFSGKTTELLRRLERYSLIGKSITVYKPDTDTRTASEITIQSTRSKISYPVITLKSDFGFLDVRVDSDVIAIDEAQFFGKLITVQTNAFRSRGKIVLVAGLDMDSQQDPFGYMGHFMSIADTVTKLTAICSCGQEAIYTKKITGKTSVVDIGDKNKYVPCCGSCYQKTIDTAERRAM